MELLGGSFLLPALLIWQLHFWGSAGHFLPRCQDGEFRCSDGSCVPRPGVCDGHKDCEDGSDENQCGHVWCNKDEFACSSRRCIPLQQLCNDIDDCGDSSDETFCQNCSAGLIPCGQSGTCVPRNKLCDGRTDCSNGWDESRELCGSKRPGLHTPPPCAASEFQCGDGQCIRLAWRCDNSWDCSDGSDEDSCDQDECQANNGGCSHYCVKQPVGFVCQCPDNMRLVGNSHCEEVDTCLERDVCDQLCVDTNANLTCACYEGYHMKTTTGECKADGHEAQLAFTSSKGIQWTSVSDTLFTEVGPHRPGPVAVLASKHTLYWAKQGQGSIYSVSMEGNPQEAAMVLLKSEGSVSGLAVDWIHQLLYWTTIESGSINVGLLDGSVQRQLITGLDKPSGVALDPLRGLLFWAQCGNVPKIERSSLDGRDRMPLVTSLIRHPVALAVDVPRQLLYWVDQRTRTISRVNFQGRDRKTVVESNGYLDRPFGLAVFEGFVYWSEEVTRSICRANKHNGSQLQVLLTNVTSPGGVVVVHPVLQPSGSSVCGRPGTTCQHKCVVSLLPEHPEFSCVSPPETQGSPAMSHPVPASTFYDPTFAEVLSLIMFLSVLLVGMALCWWREEFKPSRSLVVQRFSLTESQNPLIIQEPLVQTPVSERKLCLSWTWTVNEDCVTQTVD